MARKKPNRKKKSGKASRRKGPRHESKKGGLSSMRATMKNIAGGNASRSARSDAGNNFIKFLVFAFLLIMVVWALAR